VFSKSRQEREREREREERERERETGSVQGFGDAIVDIAWSRGASHMLAVLDASCNLYVYHIADGCTAV